MSSIPNAALHFGAQSIVDGNASYGKTRVSKSTQISYFLHCKAGCMPGQAELFRTDSLSKPDFGEPIDENNITRSFKEKNLIRLGIPKGPRAIDSNLYPYTYDKYEPYDDDSLNIALKATYRQIYGNFNLMESERPKDLERKLRNGDLTIRDFVRLLAKTSFYKEHYFENVNQQRSIELNIKHILGRPPIGQEEIIKHVQLIFNYGFDYHIDTLIDSTEYLEIFGQDIVPYPRCWNSPCGTTTSSFNKAAALARSFATSDNAIHGRKTSPEAKGGKSQILDSLVNFGNGNTIKLPEHMMTTKNEHAASMLKG